MAQWVKTPLAMQETQETGQEDPLEEGMAIHSSFLAWRIPRTEEPGGLRSMGSQSDTTEVHQARVRVQKRQTEQRNWFNV